MKPTSLFTVLTAASLLLVACSEKSSKTTSSTNTNPIGTTTGTTAGGSTGGAYTGQPNTYTTIPSDNNWGDLYNGYTIPGENCSGPASTSNPNLYGFRKGTMTLAGQQMYSPGLPWSSGNFTHNTSYFLTNVNTAKNFYETDAKLRIRFKVLPQPKTTKADGVWCFGRQTGVNTSAYGYRNLKFRVSLVEVKADGTLGTNFIGTKQVSAGLNACTTPVSFDGLNQQFPYGAVAVVHDVQSDQSCWYSSGCTGFTTLAASSCWAMDIHVSADDTVDFQ